MNVKPSLDLFALDDAQRKPEELDKLGNAISGILWQIIPAWRNNIAAHRGSHLCSHPIKP